MSHTTTSRAWRPGGERVTVGDVTFDSTVEGGVGHAFEAVGPEHVRFRSRAGLAPYSWRFCLRIDSPGDGRELTLEVADFNHFGQELWQEQAAVLSYDGESWQDIGTESITIVPWTPTGYAEEDASIDDGWHPPYGVRYRLSLNAPSIWVASPTPYTMRHSIEHLHALTARCEFFQVQEIARTHYAGQHGYPLVAVKVARPGQEDERLRVVVIAGEHPAEVAGMYAAEGLLEGLLRTLDLLADFSFWVVPATNVDGVALGRTYHNMDPSDPAAPGVNLARDWRERTQPETQAVWALLKSVRPHCVVNLHNGRHRREFEVIAPPQPHLAALLRHLREQMPLPIEHWRPCAGPGELAEDALEAGFAETAFCFETLLLQKLPHCETFRESYGRAGSHLLRGLVRGLREVYGKPQMFALAEPLGHDPLRLRAEDFVAKLPWYYYHDFASDAREHAIHNFEVNGLLLLPDHYDAQLKMRPGVEELRARRKSGEWQTLKPRSGWALLTSLHVPARMVSFDFEWEGEGLPFDEVLISSEGMPLAAAQAQATEYARYVRDIWGGEAKRGQVHFRETSGENVPVPFLPAASSPSGSGPDHLAAMFAEIVDWSAERQVTVPEDRHYGAIWSEEDKYDARDAAASAACFVRRHRETGESEWLDRAQMAREYAYRSQMHEPGNDARDGGFVHMVHGIWGTHFTRLSPPYPGVDGVDTCAIIHLLCRAAEQGLPFAREDREVIRRAATWVANNEALPGVFLHHEGATHDCQNSNALGVSALVRAYHALAEAGDGPPTAWLAAAERGLKHYLDGQEAIGVWPYWFAKVGWRGQAFHFDNIPDHGIGLYHLTRVCDREPLAGAPGLTDALKRAMRWYLGVCRTDGDTIDIDYDRRPDLGNNICFSGFTWCRFTAAATMLRVARLTGETDPWGDLALRLMEHVRRKRWRERGSREPGEAPVVAHARPEAPLATWCQAAEWDASMLGEMIEDLEALSTDT